MKKTLEYILSSIAENKDKIEVDEKEENGIIELIIKVDPSDMGRVIGKNGKIIRAIRNVMKIPAIKQDKKVNISIAESSSQIS